MMFPAGYLPEARDDLDAAYEYYESRSDGLGDRFLNSVRQAVGRIEINPALHGEVAEGIRACPTRRFPFVLYYRVEEVRVLVIAVRHGRDNPARWQSRA